MPVDALRIASVCVTFLAVNVWSAAPGCITCHPKETARFLASPMGKSLAPPEPMPPGRVQHQTSGSLITVEDRGGRMVHRLVERGIAAEYPIAYQIGAGKKGRSYLIRIGDYLLESPASWYERHGWDISPGYESLQLIDFDRPVTAECLFCHAGQAKFADPDLRRIASGAITAITCERCHGPSAEHIRKPSATNIVNPANLTGAARASVCEQCHLEGQTRVLNPQKALQDFHAGQPLEETAATYLFKTSAGEAVTQAEELGESKCARSSRDRLWCGTCHHPHGPGADRQSEIRSVCLSCHPRLTKASHPSRSMDCVSCHMPARATTNIAHVAATDHRIQRPHSSAPQYSGPDQVTPWREPPASFRERDLAMAQLQIGLERNNQGLAREGYDRLQKMPGSQLSNDADALSMLQAVVLATAPARAVDLGLRIVALKPQSASSAVNLALALKAAGRHEESEQQLRRAIDLDPSLMEAYAQLALLYDEEKRAKDSADVVGRFLKWNPWNIQFRLARAP